MKYPAFLCKILDGYMEINLIVYYKHEGKMCLHCPKINFMKNNNRFTNTTGSVL